MFLICVIYFNYFVWPNVFGLHLSRNVTIKLNPDPNRSQNNFACDIGRRKINRIEVILFLIIYSGK